MFTQDDLIYAYTRKQAVEDGEQVLLEGELGKMARDAGWGIPVYLTRSVWAVLERVEANKRTLSSLKGVLWDILYVGGMAARRCPQGEDTIVFDIRINGAGRQKKWWFYAQVGPTDIDDPAPAVTIMFSEDR